MPAASSRNLLEHELQMPHDRSLQHFIFFLFGDFSLHRLGLLTLYIEFVRAHLVSSDERFVVTIKRGKEHKKVVMQREPSCSYVPYVHAVGHTTPFS